MGTIEENFENIFTHAAEGIIVAETGSKKFYLGNPAICHLLGYTKDEFKKLHINDIHPEKELPFVLDQFKKQAEGKIKISKDLPIKKKDGTVFLADVTASPITIAGKNYVMGFFHDNTERIENEEKYKVLYETSRDAIMTLEPPAWKFVSGNHATVTMFHCKNENKFISVGPWQLSPKKQPDGQGSMDKAKKMIMKAMEEGSNFFEWTHRRYRGENFPATVLLSRVTEGKKTYLQATVRDITEQKKMENELRTYQKTLQDQVIQRTKQLENTQKALLNVLADLRSSSVRNEAILADIADGVIVVDKNGIIIRMNKSAEKLLGWTIVDSMGKNWYEILKREDEKGNPIVPEKDAIYLALTTTTTTTSGAGSSSYYYVRRDGTKFPVSKSVSPIILGGKVIGVVTVFRDITQEKEIDRMKTEFVSLASHQLRTPLTSIKWNLEMLLDKSIGDLELEQRQHVAEAFQSNEKMILLVNSLLNIGRIESGRLSIDPKLTDLGLLFKAAADKCKPQIDQAHITLIDKIPNSFAKINIDPLLISNIYTNLLSNSMKYSASGGSIELSIIQDGDYLVSSVKDSGCGIPVKEQKHIFERFFRASNVSSASIGSTGLGLYLAKEIVEASGGKIWFTSAEGKGSTFFFSLPLKGSLAQKGDVTLS